MASCSPSAPDTPAGVGTSLKILVADDTPANLRLVEVVARRMGHRVVTAQDGIEAVAQFNAEAPDLVIMDVMMPRMDGIEAVRAMRALPAPRWTPIIFCSALSQMEDIVRGFAAGGDDYLVKPVAVPVLKAKLRSYARLLGLQAQVNAYADELARWREEAEEQNRLGMHVMARLTDASGLRDPLLQYFNIPADTFSGDLLCAARAPGEVINVLLGDAAGHGLPAALTAMPLTQAFYSMTAKGFPLPSIAEELNRKLKAILPPDRFVAATLAAVDIRNQTVEVWNGGNPDALLVNLHGAVTTRWASQHPPLGILPPQAFSGQTETIVFQEAGDLVLCSDGLVEAESPTGAWLGLDGVIALLHGADDGRHRFAHLQDGLMQHLQAEAGRDDISCMVLHIPLEQRRQLRIAAPTRVRQTRVDDWRLDLSYGANELRYIDVVPAVLGFISQVELLGPHQGALFLIVSELFNNALDHGLLGLDSALKDRGGGFETYLKLRATRLARLNEGHIALAFHIHQIDHHAMLDIFIQDSGPGFDYGRLAAGPEPQALHADATRYCGRGIALVRSLCRQVVYSGTGNKVWARYALGELGAADTPA